MRVAPVAQRASAVLALAVSAGAVLVVGAPAALAEGATPPVVSTNWYWAEKALNVNGEQLPTLPDAADAASGIPSGDLGVGLLTDQIAPADKVAAVAFDLTTIPLGSTFSRFRITVPVDAAGVNVQLTEPELAACENIDAFTDAPGPTALASAPPISPPSCVKGTFDAKKGYEFDLTSMANDWSFGAPSHGITLRPFSTEAGSAPFSIALKGKNGITTSADYSVPDQATAPVVADPLLPEVAPVPASDGGVAFPPALPQVEVPLPQAVPAQPQPQVNPVPQAIAPPTRAVGFGVPPVTSTPSTGFWLALLAGMGLLGLTRMVLNDPLAPEAVDPRRRRFAKAVSGVRPAPIPTRITAPSRSLPA